MEVKALAALIVILITTLSAWVLKIRMRRRVKRALGGASVDTESELTSLNTWLRVEDAEKRHQGGKLRQDSIHAAFALGEEFDYAAQQLGG